MKRLLALMLVGGIVGHVITKQKIQILILEHELTKKNRYRSYGSYRDYYNSKSRD